MVLALDGPTPMFTIVRPARSGSWWCQAGIWRPPASGPVQPGSAARNSSTCQA